LKGLAVGKALVSTSIIDLKEMEDSNDFINYDGIDLDKKSPMKLKYFISFLTLEISEQ
jgi:hypothetical protein